MKTKRLISAENVAIEAGTFEVLQPDGFFIPYGDYPHRNGLQKFDRAAANAMEAEFKSVLGRITTAFAGRPVYIGHPDVAGRGEEFPDKKAYGRITAITPAENGCTFTVKYNKDGAALIEGGAFSHYSPHWLCEAVKGGIRPVILKSFGLTNNPNIDVPALANDAGGEVTDATQRVPTNQHQTENDMNPKLIAALVAANIIAENDSEETIITKIAAVKLAAENDTSERDALNAQVTAANDQLSNLKSQIADGEAKIAAVNDALTTARTAAANSALDLAITSGRLAEAERDTRRGELLAIENVSDFATALTTLVTAEAVLKTQSTTANLGKDGKAISAANDAAEKSKQRTALVEKAKKKFPKLEGSALFDAAWNSARRENPELFA